LPLDYDKRAAYTILELDENAINILERRVPYNYLMFTQDLRNT